MRLLVLAVVLALCISNTCAAYYVTGPKTDQPWGFVST